MLGNLHRVTKNTFRMLVLGILISILYDLIWFSLMSYEYGSDLKVDGGMERRLRVFSLYMSYVSFFLRLIIALVFWKDSLDFDFIMLGKKVEEV